MKVCPKCGFRDPPEWKNLPFQIYHEYMTLENFENLYPELATQLKKNPKIIFDEYNAYHLTKARYVHRVPKELCVDGKWFSGGSIYEKPKDPFQTKLLCKK